VLTVRRSRPREDVSGVSAAARPVLLATFDVPFAEDAIAFAVDAAVENGQPLVIVNVAEILLTHWSLVGYGYLERDELQRELRKPAELAHSLAVRVERLRVCSPHPLDALLAVVAERNPGVLVFGPDRAHVRRRKYERAARRLRERTGCLVWTEAEPKPEDAALAMPRRGPRVLVTSVLRRKR
jgi:nucleotide-binding universal stress UspA family protein